MLTVRQLAPIDAKAGLQQNISIDNSRILTAAKEREKIKIENALKTPFLPIIVTVVIFLIWKTFK